jgi:hypothetical protein
MSGRYARRKRAIKTLERTAFIGSEEEREVAIRRLCEADKVRQSESARSRATKHLEWDGLLTSDTSDEERERLISGWRPHGRPRIRDRTFEPIEPVENGLRRFLRHEP